MLVMHEATDLLYLFTLNMKPNKKVGLTVQCAACTRFPEWTPNFGGYFLKSNKLLRLCTCQLRPAETGLRAHIIEFDVCQSSGVSL